MVLNHPEKKYNDLLIENNRLKKELEAFKQKFAEINVDELEEIQEAGGVRFMKQHCLAKVSHEMRTPLTAILGLARLLIGSDLEKKQMDLVKSIKLSADHLLIMLNDILDVSKMEYDKLELEYIPFDLHDLINGLKSILYQSVTQKGLKFSVHIDSKLPRTLIGDPTRLTQVLLNLLSNAEKFTKEGFVELHVNIIQIEGGHVRIEFKVSDSGIGISPENKDRIFEEFVQENKDTARLYGGTGLGLSIVKQLVELQKGVIRLESSPNQGSSFFVELGYDIDKEEVSTKLDDVGQELELVKSARVIMAEDYPMNQYLAKNLFEKWGIDLTIVDDGEALLKALEKDTFDLILMDLQMPIIGGVQAAKQIRDRDDSTPIIAFSAHVLEKDGIQLKKQGINDFVLKPYNERELKAKLSQYLQLSLKDASEQISSSVNEEIVSSDFGLSYIKDLSAGDDDFIHEILAMFVSQVPINMNALVSSFNRGDLEGMVKIAHTVQSSFVMVDREDIKTALKKVEMWGKGMEILENPSDFLSTLAMNIQGVVESVANYIGESVISDIQKVEESEYPKEINDLNINFSKLDELGSGDMKFNQEIIGLFISQTSAQITSIKKLVGLDQFKEIGLIIHNMIASFDLIGCDALVAVSRSLESACLNPNDRSNLKGKIETYLNVVEDYVFQVEQKARDAEII